MLLHENSIDHSSHKQNLVRISEIIIREWSEYEKESRNPLLSTCKIIYLTGRSARSYVARYSLDIVRRNSYDAIR